MGSKKRKGNKRDESESAEQSRKSIPSESMTGKACRLVEHELRERRNGYQMISTASYYQIERRSGHVQNWREVKTEMDGVPGIDEAP